MPKCHRKPKCHHKPSRTLTVEHDPVAEFVPFSSLGYPNSSFLLPLQLIHPPLSVFIITPRVHLPRSEAHTFLMETRVGTRSRSWSHDEIVKADDLDLLCDLDHHWWSLIFDLILYQLILPWDHDLWSWSLIFLLIKDQRSRSKISNFGQIMAILTE